MSVWTEIRARWRALRHGAEADGETAEEIGFHLEMEERKYRERGYGAEEARRLARVAFGGVTQTREQVRAARGVTLLHDLARDTRQAFRQLRRAPGFTLVAVATLGLGIGANTAVFSVLNAVLLRPMPFAEPDRLVMVWETDRRSETTREPAAWPDYLDFRAALTSTFADLAAMSGRAVSHTPAGAEPARLRGLAVTASLFDVLGIRPMAGRLFAPDETEPGGPRVVVLGERFWRARLAGDPAVIGAPILLSDEPYTVIGVVSDDASVGIDQIHGRAAYHSTYQRGGAVEVWLPLQASAAAFPRSTHPFLLLGRLQPGMGLAAGQEAATAVALDIERRYPVNVDRGVFLEPLERVVLGPIEPVVWLLVGAVALVLTVACVNVANLLLARGTVRTREVAVRGALGAGLGRLGRQFAVEAVVLALAGTAIGLVLAYGGVAALVALAPPDVPRLDQVRIDGRVLGVSIAVAVGVGLIFGLVPTLQAFRLDLLATLRGDTPGGGARRTGSLVRSGLVAAELAFAVVLLVGAGLLVRSFQTVLQVDPGFRADGVLKAEFDLPPSRYPREWTRVPDSPAMRAFHASLLERARALPGVVSASIAMAHPLDRSFSNGFVVVGREGEAEDWPEIATRVVSDGYFATVGVGLRTGRLLGAADDAVASPVVLINRAAADRFFSGQDPLGQQVRFWGAARRIVGVVENERIFGLTETPPPALYLPLEQTVPNTGVLLVRTDRPARQLANPVRQAVWSIDPALPVFGVEPLIETLADSMAERRFAMTVLGVFAGLALVLALVGIYGVVSYTTAQRTRELGIRSALGASRTELMQLVLRREFRIALVGVVVGGVGALAATRLMAGLLFGVGSTDLVTYVVAVVLVLLAALGAAWLPARRAARVAPVDALLAD